MIIESVRLLSKHGDQATAILLNIFFSLQIFNANFNGNVPKVLYGIAGYEFNLNARNIKEDTQRYSGMNGYSGYGYNSQYGYGYGYGYNR